MPVLLLFLMIAASTLHGIFLNSYNANYPGADKNKSPVYSSILGLLVAFITFAVRGFDFDFSWIAVGLGLVNGVAVALFNYFLGKGSELGPYSFVMVSALSAGIIMPLMLSVVLDGFPGIFSLLGVLVMLIAFVLLCVDFKNKVKPHKAFYPTCILLALVNGTYGVLNALEKRIEHGAHDDEFIITTYLTTSVVAIVLLICQNRRKTLSVFRQTPKSILFAILGAACISANINLMMVTLGYKNFETILFTVLNGGTLVLSALLSLLLYREKINLQKWCGIAVAAASMALFAI